MNRIARKVLVLGLTGAAALALPIAVAGPAAADNCQPDELIVRQVPGQSGYNSALPCTTAVQQVFAAYCAPFGVKPPLCP